MPIDRRGFLKGAAAGGLLWAFGFNFGKAKAYAAAFPAKRGKISTTICPYCGVGCGAIVTESEGWVVNVEGDPDHPINRGALCSKGSALYQVANSGRRLSRIKYRAPGAPDWEERSWDWAVARIAERIKETRDATFVATDSQGRVVNRADGIACLGGAALDNEECFAYSKFARALGVTYLEHQARI